MQHRSRHPDICIAGAGIIGLSLALELQHRGYRVTVFEQGAALRESSSAAAGMLAAGDPENPAPLRSLADLSLSLYPAFLDRLQALTSLQVPFQTQTTLQSLQPGNAGSELTSAELADILPELHPAGHRFTLLNERSIDPRQLATALLSATQSTMINLRLHEPILWAAATKAGVAIHTAAGAIHATTFIDCTGAWAASTSKTQLPIAPRKGQMLSLGLPSSFPLGIVVRTRDVYVVPRLTGLNAGRAIIGATVEDAGFDKTIHRSDVARLRALATTLLPALANASYLDAWAGLRPATPDGLPLLGSFDRQPNHLLATGHYRNGILLAPATALVMAQLISGERAAVDLTPFSPSRFALQPA